MKADIRKIVVTVEETRREMGREVSPATRKAVAAAVIKNPFAGLYAEDLEDLMAIGEELGGLLGEKAVAALGVSPHDIESYGKAAIVGEKGEWEHAAAILHPRLGKPLRAAVEKGAALVPSAKKIGGLGAAIDVPLGHKDAAFVRSHFDAMEVGLPDGPHEDELLLALVMTSGPRIHARVGGLKASEIKGEDGLR